MSLAMISVSRVLWSHENDVEKEMKDDKQGRRAWFVEWLGRDESEPITTERVSEREKKRGGAGATVARILYGGVGLDSARA